tara:strand:+ start:505 stop:2148 length:1644 start_codon:yes stop_codon:yes gene_type:complete
MPVSIPVLFGTETGNAEYCADLLVTALEEEGFSAELIDMDDFEPSDISTHKLVFIITSTYGNGDPPFNAEAFLRYLQAEEPYLPDLHFAVCGLGDRSFAHFAQCGKDFEKVLVECAATLIFERVDCDDEFEVPFDNFKNTAIKYMQEKGAALIGGGGNSAGSQDASTGKSSSTKSEASFSRDKPFMAPVLVKGLLSKPGSAKETMHYELDISGWEVDFQVGDCFGVHPRNSKKAIESVLKATGFKETELVQWERKERPLGEALGGACLNNIGVDFVRTLASLKGASEGAAAKAVSGGDAALSEYIRNRHVLDALLEQSTEELDAQQLVDGLRKLQPRLYSVASSPIADKRRVGFTVETLRYSWNEREIEGVATCWLADQIEVGDTVPIYLMRNENFHFSKDERPVIMVGPGTGIAPFRAYLQEVEAAGIKNQTWLFFGHQHQDKDFLYEEEIQAWKSSGTLTRADFAWSRDQDEKIYVQDRIKENAEALWDWIEKGAEIYICGDALGMAPGVAEAFKAIARDQGGHEDVEAWLQSMISEKRYKADVY